MILHQFYLNCLAHASYIVADETTGSAAVVDPQRDVEAYLEFARAHGLRIEHVILTHFHADFLAGHLELRDLTGARIYLGRAATAEYAFTPLADRSTIELGRVRLEAMETPGHTPESICLLVYDDEPGVGNAPAAVLTGDTLFVGDVGRPDLRAALGWTAADLGALLYDSLHNKLLTLPDDSRIYPAHGAGSLCGKAISKETVSTMGEQRRVNYALQPMTKEAFLALVTADQPEAPAYFTYDAVLNSRERATLGETLTRELRALTLDEVLEKQAAGAQLLDTRDAGAFGPAHLKGSVNVGLGGQFASWAGAVLDPATPIVLITDPGAEAESALRLGRIGFDNVAGYLSGGLASAALRPDLIAATARISPEVMASRQASATPPLVVDVRSAAEHAKGAIAGARNIPLTQLPQRIGEVDAARPVLVHCAGGYRSAIAASLLERAGHADVSELAGGLAAWQAAGLPTV